MDSTVPNAHPRASVLRDCAAVVGVALALSVPAALIGAGSRPAAPAPQAAAEPLGPPAPAELEGVGRLAAVVEAEVEQAAPAETKMSPRRKSPAREKVGPVARAFGDAADRQIILEMIRRHQAGESEESIRALAEVIHREALREEMDPLIVAAMVAKESSFEPEIVSPKGATGLMQLLPVVGEHVAARYGVEWAGTETLNDPQKNVRLGILYYKELRDRFDGDQVKALTAYCYGPGWVDRRLEEESFEGSGYASSVLSLYAQLAGDRDRRGERRARG